MSWENRIVGYGEEVADQLLANPKNYRTHPAQQQEAMQGVLDEIGWIQDVIVNRRTGHIVDGHLRVELSLKSGGGKIPVKYIDVSEEEEALILATFDPVSAMAGIDKDVLKDLLASIDPANAGIASIVANLESELGIGDIDPNGGADVETLLDQAVQLEPGNEFLVIVCDGDEFNRLRSLLGLEMVRRGGYKPGSAFDATSIARTMKASALIERLSGGAES